MPSPGRYPYAKLPSYHRLRSEDVGVWEAFIDKFPGKLWLMDYDVKVGLGREPLEDIPPELHKDWRDLTRKRIDAVAWGKVNIFIIELKPRASLGAIGQVLGYSELWVNLHDAGRRVRPMIICYSSDHDTNTVAKRSGVEIVEVRGAEE